MRTYNKSKQGYALITTVAILVVIMALCSMLIAYTMYGRSLFQKSQEQYAQSVVSAEAGNEFIALAEIYGDDLLNAYRSRGFTGQNPVSKTVDGVTTTISREVGMRSETCTITLVLRGGESGDTKTIQVFRDEIPEAAAEYEIGYTQNEAFWYFAGWSADGGESVDYATASELPAAKQDTTYSAVYSQGTAYTLTVVTENSPETTIPYYGGETLSHVLKRQNGEELYFANYNNYHYYTRTQRDITGILEKATWTATADTISNVLANSQPGDVIVFNGELSEAVTVTNGVTIRANKTLAVTKGAETEGAENTEPQTPFVAGDGYVMTAITSGDETCYYFEENTTACYYTKANESSTLKIGTLSAVINDAAATPFADEDCSIPGIRLQKSVVLTQDITLSTPLVVDSKVVIDLNGHTLSGSGLLLYLGEKASLTIKNGTIAVSNVQNDAGAIQAPESIIGNHLALTNVVISGSLFATDEEKETALANGAETADIYYQLGNDDTLSGNLTVYAFPKSKHCVTYYGADGKALQSVFCGSQETFSARSYRFGEHKTERWCKQSTNEHIKNGDAITANTAVYPYFEDGTAAVTPKSGTVTFTYYQEDATQTEGKAITVQKTIYSGQSLVLAYYLPQNRQSQPLFFVEGEEKIQPGTSRYSELYSAVTANDPSYGFVAVYSSQVITWGDQNHQPTTVFDRNNTYKQLHTVRFLWSDGTECGSNSIPHGTKLCICLCEATESGYRVTMEYDETNQQLASVSGETVIQADRLEHGFYDKTNQIYTVYCLNHMDNYRALSDAQMTSLTVTADVIYTFYGGTYHYRDRNGQRMSVSYSGVPKGTDIIYAYCDNSGVIMPEDDSFFVQFFVDESGVYEKTDTQKFSTYQDLFVRLQASLIVSEGDAKDDTEAAGWAEELQSRMYEQLSDGWFYLPGENENENGALVILLYCDEVLNWYTPAQNASSDTTMKNIFESGTVKTAYAGQSKEIFYTLLCESDEGQELFVRISLDGCKVVQWNEG